jgi:hypothetical protein
LHTWKTIFATALLSLTACAEAGVDRPDDAGASAIGAYEPTDTEKAEVVATLQRLFDALRAGDEALLRSVVDASVVMHYSETLDGRTTLGSSTLDALATRITSSEVPLIERLWDPIVVVDGPLATIWTPYDFYAGQAFSHCGVDAANLMRTDDGWKIVALAWTRRQPPDCALHPGGPPS